MKILTLLSLLLLTFACGSHSAKKEQQEEPRFSNWNFNVVERIAYGLRFTIKVSGNTMELAHDMQSVPMLGNANSKDQRLVSYCKFSLAKGLYTFVEGGDGIKIVPAFTSDDAHNLLRDMTITFTKEGSGQWPQEHTWVDAQKSALLFSQIPVFSVRNDKGVWHDAVQNSHMALTAGDKELAIIRLCSRQARQ